MEKGVQHGGTHGAKAGYGRYIYGRSMGTASSQKLIDFIPEVKGQRLKDVPSFKRVAGGAPANVVGAVTKLGIPSKFLTKLGDDPFGDYIVEVLSGGLL